MCTRAAIITGGMLLASFCARAGQDPRVQRLYEKARAEQAANANDAAVTDYLEMLSLDPTLGAAYNNLGRLYYNLGRYPEAVAVLAKGLKVDPSMHPAELMLGATYYQMGMYEKATPLLEKAVRAMPGDRFARITLIHVLSQSGQLDEAVKQLSQLIAQAPNDQQAWYLMGRLQLQLSQQAFARVHAIDSKSPLAHELSGEIMESMKNVPGAITEYKKALSTDPSDLEAMQHLADAYWHAGQWPEARDAFTALLKQDPGNCLAHWKLANSLDELGEQVEEAMQQTNAAIAICPSMGQARVERARILLRLGKPAEALPELLSAERTAPDESSIQAMLAIVYKALGDPARASQANAKFQSLQQAEHAGAEQHAADVMRANP